MQNETEAISQGAYDDSIYNSPNLGMMVVMVGVRKASMMELIEKYEVCGTEGADRPFCIYSQKYFSDSKSVFLRSCRLYLSSFVKSFNHMAH